ncbi:MAG: glycosyltransferase family 2 protein [Planctomycetota bacterium]|nr:glycosyltransferase family 2 protein [Planctomycetota bacterium]
MTSFAITFTILLALIAAFQSIFVFALVRQFFKQFPEILDRELPQAAVLLSLRGADPHLASGLRQLREQNYPRYEIRIVVDSDADPAWEVVNEIVCEPGRVPIRTGTLRDPLETCSLKCSSLVQLVEELPDAIEVVVLADADLVFDANWLRELVAPLANPRVGATYGNRWFWPDKARWGSLVRYLWNVAAVVPMYVLKIPWGGTFAIRTSALKNSGLIEKWKTSVVDDAPVRSALEEISLRLEFVPGRMMVNREDCGLPFSLDFIKRQLTWTKLYHPNWWVVVFHAFTTALILLLAVVGAPLIWFAGEPFAAAILAGSWLGYTLWMVGLVWLMEVGVRNVLLQRGQRVVTFDACWYCKLFFAILLTQLVHIVAVALAMTRRKVRWRGIDYEVLGPWNIRMIRYDHYTHVSAQDSNTSL